MISNEDLFRVIKELMQCINDIAPANPTVQNRLAKIRTYVNAKLTAAERADQIP